jgi:hypothetical protein
MLFLRERKRTIVGTCQTIVLVRHFPALKLFINYSFDAKLLLVHAGLGFVKDRLTLTEAVA